jgi:hypothetical protein
MLNPHRPGWPVRSLEQCPDAAKNNDSAKVNRMVNSATRYIKVIDAQAIQAPKQRALSRAFAGSKQNSYFLY